jgi:hypothetical protein
MKPARGLRRPRSQPGRQSTRIVEKRGLMELASWRGARVALSAGVVCALVATGTASAGITKSASPLGGGTGVFSDGVTTAPAGFLGGSSTFSTASGQHGFNTDHLPSARENVDLVGKLRLETPAAFRYDPRTGDPDPSQPGVVDGQIADVSIFKNAAYLASWSEPSCRRGGFFSVDISNPAAPKQLAFVPALPGTYHGEGTHTITLNTSAFKGDVLAVNNEPCNAQTGVGGFDLYDVSDPAKPQILVQGAGDQSPDDTTETQDPKAVPNSAHSIFIWQDGSKAYAVIVDNTEAHDTDIFDITDPRKPVFIGDNDLLELADEQGVDVIDNSANGDAIFLHDMVVKKINGVQTMLASYWDSGYIKLNVADPANPRIIGDSKFENADPIMEDPATGSGWVRPEGNGHEAEFSHDNKYVLAADEDFNQYRFLGRINRGGDAGDFTFGVAGQPDEGPIVTPNRTLSGDTRYVGDACTPGSIAPATADVKIAVAVRGTCTFQVKTENAESKGYTGVIIFNNATGAPPCDQVLNMDFTNYTGDAIALFVPRSTGLRLINAYNESSYSCGDPESPSTPNPEAPREGFPLTVSVTFDGWGYMHLYDNSGNDLTTVDDFAIEEGQDPRYATGFGDLTVHEFATDPDKNLGYVAHYAGGLRVMSFGPDGLKQVGKFIDVGGNNFWGVEVVTTSSGERLIAASDRDSGLYLFRYTGPGGTPTPPAATATPTPTPGAATQQPATQQLAAAKDITKPRISLLSASRQSIKSLRGDGLAFRIGSDEQVKLSVTLRGRFTSTLKKGARGEARKLGQIGVPSLGANKTVTVRLKLSAALRKQLRSEKRLPAVLSVEATDAAGNLTTRTKTITFR